MKENAIVTITYLEPAFDLIIGYKCIVYFNKKGLKLCTIIIIALKMLSPHIY